MKKLTRKLTLSTEVLRRLTPDDLVRVDGGTLQTSIVIDTHQGSCGGRSCDQSCATLCFTLPR